MLDEHMIKFNRTSLATEAKCYSLDLGWVFPKPHIFGTRLDHVGTGESVAEWWDVGPGQKEARA